MDRNYGDSASGTVIPRPSETPDYDPTEDLTVLEDSWLEKLGLTPDRLHTINRQRRSP